MKNVTWLDWPGSVCGEHVEYGVMSMTQLSDDDLVTQIFAKHEMTTTALRLRAASQRHLQSQKPDRLAATAARPRHVTRHRWRHVELFPRRRTGLVDHPHGSWRHLYTSSVEQNATRRHCRRRQMQLWFFYGATLRLSHHIFLANSDSVTLDVTYDTTWFCDQHECDIVTIDY